LQQHTGVNAADWRKELLEIALGRFNRMSLAQIQRFIAENYEIQQPFGNRPHKY
jgi:hypothetical protein